MKRITEKIIGNAIWFLQLLIGLLEKWVLGVGSKSSEYQSSAQLSRVICRFKEAEKYEFSSKEDFVTIHQKYVHPDVVLDDNYSLYAVTEDEAIFVDCGSIDVFDKNYAFAYHGQFLNAINLISMPISSFHLLSKGIKLPTCPVIHLANHGRCGSTLLTKVFQGIPNSLSIGETNGFLHLAEMSRQDGETQYTKLKQICYSVVMCTLKHANSRKSSTVFLKCQNTAVFITDLMIETVPSMKQVFMYRQPVPFVQSYEKLQATNNWSPLSAYMCSFWGGVGHHRIMKNTGKEYNEEMVSKLSGFAKWSVVWVSAIAAYQNLLKEGYEIKSLKYEHLTANPSEILEALFKYVDLPLSLIPDVGKIFSRDSQAGTPFSSRNGNKELLKNCLTPITDHLKKEVNELCDNYRAPHFWDDISLEGKI